MTLTQMINKLPKEDWVVLVDKENNTLYRGYAEHCPKSDLHTVTLVNHEALNFTHIIIID